MDVNMQKIAGGVRTRLQVLCSKVCVGAGSVCLIYFKIKYPLPSYMYTCISGVFSASQPQPNGCVCDATAMRRHVTAPPNNATGYMLRVHGIFWSIGSILLIKTTQKLIHVYINVMYSYMYM